MGYVTIEESDDEKSIVTPNCRLVFRRIGERWVHSIEVGTGLERCVFAQTVEADPDRDDYRQVVSPTYQDLHFQNDERGTHALLVGQYGPRHFSAAIQVAYREGRRPEDHTPGPAFTTIEVDVAERCRERIEVLASTYTIPSSDLRDKGVWEVSAQGWVGQAALILNTSQSPEARVVLSQESARTFRVQIVRTLLPSQSGSRLVYRWQVTNAGSS